MKPQKIFKMLIWIAASLGAVFFLLPKTQLQPKFLKHTEYKPLYGTTVKLDVCYIPEEEEELKPAFAEAWKKLESIQEEMNVFNEQSELADINRSYPEAIQVSEDMYRILQQSLYYNQLTGGMFDVTVWPLIKLWKKAAKENRYPTTEELAAVRSRIGSKNIELPGEIRVRLKNADVKIDLGGIGAGFAADEAAKIFRTHGFANFLVDAGGDMFAGGSNCEGKKWRIGINDPRDKAKFVDVVELSDMAVSTSGNYEQYFEIQGERWSHIINPVTGYPQRGVASATLIAPRGIDVDAVATALCVWDARTAIAFVDKMGPEWASVIFSGETDEGLIRTESKNYNRYKSKSKQSGDF